jgi:hypothetical protein
MWWCLLALIYFVFGVFVREAVVGVKGPQSEGETEKGIKAGE